MSSLILVVNCGSSSVKFALIDPHRGDEPLKGIAERLGAASDAASITFKHERKETLPLTESTHLEALKAIVDKLKSLGLYEQVVGVGHRVVHGGEYFSQSVRINDDVREKIVDCIRLAPLHNPAHIAGIDAARHAFPDLPQVAVFDTAFHQHMPERAYLYPLPYELYTKTGIRRYGFHGTSYRYIAARAQQLMQDFQAKIIVAHLGNGGSVAAIDGDHSVDTTMGLTPLEGIVHGTRCGDIDPAIPTMLIEQEGMTVEAVNQLLWKESGLLGLSQRSNDARTLEDAALEQDTGALRALSIYAYRLAKHIAAQMVALNGTDALVFTGGIGENSSYIRESVLKHLACLGWTLDVHKNDSTIRGQEGRIDKGRGPQVWVIPTNEELLIAQDTWQLMQEASHG